MTYIYNWFTNYAVFIYTIYRIYRTLFISINLSPANLSFFYRTIKPAKRRYKWYIWLKHGILKGYFDWEKNFFLNCFDPNESELMLFIMLAVFSNVMLLLWPCWQSSKWPTKYRIYWGEGNDNVTFKLFSAICASVHLSKIFAKSIITRKFDIELQLST